MRKEYDFSKARRGPIVTVLKGKTRITIRLDNDLLDWFRARAEVVVRRVVRQELGQAVPPRPRRCKTLAAYQADAPAGIDEASN